MCVRKIEMCCLVRSLKCHFKPDTHIADDSLLLLSLFIQLSGKMSSTRPDRPPRPQHHATTHHASPHAVLQTSHPLAHSKHRHVENSHSSTERPANASSYQPVDKHNPLFRSYRFYAILAVSLTLVLIGVIVGALYGSGAISSSSSSSTTGSGSHASSSTGGGSIVIPTLTTPYLNLMASTLTPGPLTTWSSNGFTFIGKGNATVATGGAGSNNYVQVGVGGWTYCSTINIVSSFTWMLMYQLPPGHLFTPYNLGTLMTSGSYPAMMAQSIGGKGSGNYGLGAYPGLYADAALSQSGNTSVTPGGWGVVFWTFQVNTNITTIYVNGVLSMNEPLLLGGIFVPLTRLELAGGSNQPDQTQNDAMVNPDASIPRMNVIEVGVWTSILNANEIQYRTSQMSSKYSLMLSTT